jgi:hypothetical protein
MCARLGRRGDFDFFFFRRECCFEMGVWGGCTSRGGDMGEGEKGRRPVGSKGVCDVGVQRGDDVLSVVVVSSRERTYVCFRSAFCARISFSMSALWTATLKRFQKFGSFTAPIFFLWNVSEGEGGEGGNDRCESVCGVSLFRRNGRKFTA